MENMTSENEKKEDRNLDLIKDYQNEVPIPVICGAYCVSSTRIYQILDDYGIPRRGTHKKADRNKEIVKSFKKGVPVPDIATDHKISDVRVYQILDQMGVSVKG